MLHHWPLGDTLCQIYAALISFSVNYNDADHHKRGPLQHTPLKATRINGREMTVTKRHYKLIIVASWVHSVFWSTGPLFKWGSIKLDEFTHTCKPNWGGKGLANKSYMLSLAIFAFALPVGAMVYAYFRIYRIARASKRKNLYYLIPSKNNEIEENVEAAMTKTHASNAGPDEDNQALKTVLLLVGSFAACWALYSLATV